MSKKDLLIEIGTEELPPKALKRLATVFADEIHAGLDKNKLSHKTVNWYATPRRLAVIVEKVITKQADHEIVRRGPALTAAYDNNGNPTKAAEGFARSCGVEVKELSTEETDKGSWLTFRSMETGLSAAELIPGIITTALAKLPIPKRMRWADRDAEFVRPVHWSIVMLGKDIIPCEIMDTQAGNESRGHRFHYPKGVRITSPANYLKKLREKACVIADFDERRALIKQMVTAAGEKLGGRAWIEEDLLDEVTSLVEWPTVITGTFENKFLQLPREVLIATMQDHQRYFAVTESHSDKLLNHFITIANIDSKAPEEVSKGNEKVIRPRLTDAAFFWQQDCAQPFENFTRHLADVVFQKQLGTLADKTERIKTISAVIAEKLKADKQHAVRAATLAKCDLFTAMVGEFPELQGIMGRYYAQKSNEAEDIACALDEQYMPRFAGDTLPTTTTGQILAIADKLDTLVGLFGIGQQPTGDKDPFALRRATLGILRILIERKLEISLCELLDIANSAYMQEHFKDTGVSFYGADDNTMLDIQNFIYDRLAGHMKNLGYSTLEADAVISQRPTNIYLVPAQLEAVKEFSKLPEAESLIAANKRVANILKQAEGNGETFTAVDPALLQEQQEKELFNALSDTAGKASGLHARGDFTGYLKSFATLKKPVDAFFDTVMVMAEDTSLKRNRLALLRDLRNAMNKIADISRLQQ